MLQGSGSLTGVLVNIPAIWDVMLFAVEAIIRQQSVTHHMTWNLHDLLNLIPLAVTFKNYN
jgi:hypothetical protein